MTLNKLYHKILHLLTVCHLSYVVYPKKMEWDFASEKQLQTTLLQTSGGITGAGPGHNQKICYQTFPIYFQIHAKMRMSKVDQEVTELQLLP